MLELREIGASVRIGILALDINISVHDRLDNGGNDAACSSIAKFTQRGVYPFHHLEYFANVMDAACNLSNTRNSAISQHVVGILVLLDINISFQDRQDDGVMSAACYFSNKRARAIMR